MHCLRSFILPIGLVVLSFMTIEGCARPERTPSPGMESPRPAQGAAGEGTVVDPRPNDPPCSGYSLDGVSIGQSLSDLLRLPGVTATSSPDAGLEGYTGSSFVFRARRPGRRDDLRIGATGSGSGATVAAIRATIIVRDGDTWPRSLFDLVGNPSKATFNEWIWVSPACRATLHLAAIDQVGPVTNSRSYILDVRRYP